jgi:hypothetical protein
MIYSKDSGVTDKGRSNCSGAVDAADIEGGRLISETEGNGRADRTGRTRITDRREGSCGGPAERENGEKHDVRSADRYTIGKVESDFLSER